MLIVLELNVYMVCQFCASLFLRQSISCFHQCKETSLNDECAVEANRLISYSLEDQIYNRPKYL